MKSITLKGRIASRGLAEGYALVVPHSISFLSDIDITEGIIRVPSSPLKGQSVEGKVLVFPTGRGSTADPYGLYMLKKAMKAPAAVVNSVANPTTVAGCIVSRVPMLYSPDDNLLDVVRTGDYVKVNGDVGTMTVTNIDA